MGEIEEAVRALARMARLLERACDGGLSLAHYRVLAAVAGGDVRASHVARRLALGKPTVSASVDALERRGLLLREGVADDQRATALRLTDAGRRVLGEAERAMTARLRVVIEQLEDPDVVLNALADLGRGLDVVTERRHGAER